MESSRTYSIEINVKSVFVEKQSIPEKKRYVFSYTITINNTGKIPAKLLKRHWYITDANGEIMEVEGDGVVGETPYLMPGEVFQYTSGTIIKTPVGCMHGSYQMIADDGKYFDAIITPFTLSTPKILH